MLLNHFLSLVPRKPVFGVCDQVKLIPACSATETSQRFEIWDIEARGIILPKQRTTKVLIRLRGCTGWSAPFCSHIAWTGFLMMWLFYFDSAKFIQSFWSHAMHSSASSTTSLFLCTMCNGDQYLSRYIVLIAPYTIFWVQHYFM